MIEIVLQLNSLVLLPPVQEMQLEWQSVDHEPAAPLRFRSSRS